jgi:hypothetical protein
MLRSSTLKRFYGNFLLFLWILSITVSVSSCTSHYVKDNIALGVKRGYVEFYYDKGDVVWPVELTQIVQSPNIYSFIDGDEFFEGRTVPHPKKEGRFGLRIAKRPGNYTFRVWFPIKDEAANSYLTTQFGLIDAKITIHIKEDFVTPVRVYFKSDQDTGNLLTLSGEKAYFLKY